MLDNGKYHDSRKTAVLGNLGMKDSTSDVRHVIMKGRKRKEGFNANQLINS